MNKHIYFIIGLCMLPFLLIPLMKISPWISLVMFIVLIAVVIYIFYYSKKYKTKNSNKQTHVKIRVVKDSNVDNINELEEKHKKRIEEIEEKIKSKMKNGNFSSSEVKTFINGKEVKGQEQQKVINSMKERFDNKDKSRRMPSIQNIEKSIKSEDVYVPQESDMIECEHCGAKNKKDKKKCWGCGRKFK